ncbi:MAG TPA: c-type cytochrome [Vicinamibacteria bacterium]|nr:c-type cytochrome [Vicinamibacteria bacterium]
MKNRAIVVGLLVVASGAAAAELPATAVADLYKRKCSTCHGPDGNSPLEPLNFTDDKWNHGSEPAAVAKVIAEGVTGTAMLPFKAQLKPEQVEALAAHVRAFDKSLKSAKKK